MRMAATAANSRKCLSVNRGALAALVARDRTPGEVAHPPIVNSVSTLITQIRLRFHGPSSESRKLHSQKANLVATPGYAAIRRGLALVAYFGHAPLLVASATLIRKHERERDATRDFSRRCKSEYLFAGDYRQGADNNDFMPVTQF